MGQTSQSCCDVPGWIYVKDIEINNAGNPARSNYQQLIVLNTLIPISQNKMQASGADIRFTTEKCGQFLNYWIEDGINSASTEIWILIPSIPANGTERIYMYYGNPAASAMSSFNSVFTNVLTINGNQTLNGNQSAEWIEIQAGSNITTTSMVSFTARKIILSGVINGDFRGYGPGAGPGTGGNGGGAVGGGGGGYGGNGGNGGGGQGFGGPGYGTINGTDIDRGSGGAGSDCNASAAGGGAVSMYAASIEINGSISVRGENAQNCCCNDLSEAAGGGAGGGILFIADYIGGSGTLNASGGRGGDSDDKEGGGGGAGGRIKFLYTYAKTFNGTANVTPGQNGNGNQCCPQPGQAGTVGNLDLPDYITVHPEKFIRVFPVADFSAVNVCSGAPAAFSDQSVIASGAIVNWTWDFGDGQTSTLPNPQHNYLSDGPYTITLAVSSDSTCTHLASKQITVYSAPAVAFSATDVCLGTSNLFTDLSSVTAPYTITNWQWNFGDGQTSALQNPDHTYASAGNYNVALTVTTDAACQNTLTQTVKVFPSLSVSLTPVDILCRGANTGEIDLTVNGGTAAFIYTWSNNSTTEDLTNIAAGLYTVTVTDANNCSTAGSVTINEPQDMISVEGDNISHASCFGFSDGSIEIAVTGGSTPYSYNWSNNQTASIISSLAAGDYTVTITDNNGCSITESYIVSEPPPLVLSVSPKDTTLSFGMIVQLASSLMPPDGNAVFSWTPGAGLSCTNCANPQLTGEQTTTYYVTATNSVGCMANDNLKVNVTLDKVLYIPNAFSPNADGINDIFTVYTYGEKRFKMSIFDRWGGEVFTSTDLSNGWNGTLNGNELNQGVYVFDIFIEYLDRTAKRERGSVTLIR